MQTACQSRYIRFIYIPPIEFTLTLDPLAQSMLDTESKGVNMKLFRMRVDAGLFFTVQATDRQEALKKADKAMAVFMETDGGNVTPEGFESGVTRYRCYVNDHNGVPVEPTIEDEGEE